MVLFFANDLNHLNWIKDYPNSLFCADDYTLKNYIFNFNEEGLNTIREQVMELNFLSLINLFSILYLKNIKILITAILRLIVVNIMILVIYNKIKRKLSF